MRVFIAIEISGAFRETLARIQSYLRYAGADVKWVDKANIHVTLKFLGNIQENKCDEVKAVLDAVASHTKQFNMALQDIGAFPKIEYPKVIWAGIGSGAKELAALADEIDGELSKIGFVKELRVFAAHLTLGRVRSAKNKEALKEKMLSAVLPEGPSITQDVKSVILFQSTLTPKGSIYTKLLEAKFARE